MLNLLCINVANTNEKALTDCTPRLSYNNNAFTAYEQFQPLYLMVSTIFTLEILKEENLSIWISFNSNYLQEALQVWFMFLLSLYLIAGFLNKVVNGFS